MSMTVETFKKHLQDLDEALDSVDANMFDCGVKQIGRDEFEYQFDGFLTCTFKLLEDESVEASVDGYDKKFESILAWKRDAFVELYEPMPECYPKADPNAFT